MAIRVGILVAALLTIGASGAGADQKINESLLGPTSVPAQIETDKEALQSASPNGLSDALIGFTEFKKRTEEETGLNFGGDFGLLYQNAQGGTGPSDALSIVFRFYGTWSVVNRGTPDVGSLVYKFENRSRIGGETTPQQIGTLNGYAGLTATAWSDQDWLLSNFYWHQHFANGNGSFVVGQLDATDYVDVSELANPWTAFANLAFQNNPTMPIPSQGLGGAMRWNLTDRWLGIAGIADANADPTIPRKSASKFFETGETFKHFAVGWTPNFDNRYSDHIQLTVWHIDDREEAQKESDWGLALSAIGTFGNWKPFLRAGWANGESAFLDRSISVGTAYSVASGRDQLGVGFNVGRAPSISQTQFTSEAYYKYQPLHWMQITPSVQWIVNPANAPKTHDIFIAGIRLRNSY
jgi:porin